MPENFVHLHLQPTRFLPNGEPVCRAFTPAMLANACSTAAITDRGSVKACPEFAAAFQAKGSKLIPGAELLLSLTPDVAGYLVFLAENREGYENLKFLAESPSPLKTETLIERKNGLFVLTGGTDGIVANALLANGFAAGKQVLQQLLSLFGADRIFPELCYHGSADQRIVNSAMLNYAKTLKLSIVASNQVLFLRREDAVYENLMRKAAGLPPCSEEQWLKSGSDMNELFKSVPEAISNTEMLADRCTGLTGDFPPERNDVPSIHQIVREKEPLEYVTAMLNDPGQPSDRILNAWIKAGNPVLSPDLEKSSAGYTCSAEGLRPGLLQVKGMTKTIADAILRERPFSGLDDLRAKIPELTVGQISTLAESGALKTFGTDCLQCIQIRIGEKNVSDETLQQLAALFKTSNGSVPVNIRLHLDNGTDALIALPETYRIAITDEILLKLKQMFGDLSVRLIPVVPETKA